MRKGVSLAAGLALLAAAALGSNPANALTIPAAAALKEAAGAVSLTETVSCRLVRRCGYYGCDWRRVCWAPEPYYDRRHYSHYERPYYRPVYRPYGHYRPRVYHRPYGYDRPRPYYRTYDDYRPPVHYDRPYTIYRPYVPPPWVSGPYFVRRYTYY